MSKIMGLAAAMALFAGASAFAQNSGASDTQAAPPAASSSAAAPSGEAAKPAAEKPMHHHHHHHHGGQASGSTDHDADKLNACQADAKPTPEQEQCLRHAENAPS